MASYDTLQKLAAHPEWIAPRSDVRVFLGEPGAPEATKTAVEPGNSFSPGMGTFGVTWWLRFPDTGRFFAPEKADLQDLTWRYEEGFLPVLECRAEIENVAVVHTLFQDGNTKESNESVCAELALHHSGENPLKLQVFVALRSLGPVGGRVRGLAVAEDGRSFRRADGEPPLLGFDVTPAEMGCGIGDPSPIARKGAVPRNELVKDRGDGWCFGLARFDLELESDEHWSVRYECPHQQIEGQGPICEAFASKSSVEPEAFGTRRDALLELWTERFSHFNIEVPDQRFREAFFTGLQHMLTAMVGDQARIAPLYYPLVWLRDSVYIIRSLDQAGFHREARIASEFCGRNDFFGGFGAEGDAPGQGIWALVEHYRLTHDKEWLERNYAHIARKCDWIFRMRRATEPIRVVTDAPVLSLSHTYRTLGQICAPAEDGIIMGSMDHHIAKSWCNHWAIEGLRGAAFAARELGREEDAKRFTEEADELKEALRTFANKTEEYFDWQRTATSLVWPTRAWEEDAEGIAGKWDEWWEKNRGNGENYKPEKYWLYFESGQAHNGLRLGRREQAWRVAEHLLTNQDLPGLYGWREGKDGVGMANVMQGVTIVNDVRGCQRLDSVTPHGWSQSEFWLLQRAMLLEEWRDELLLFSGVPQEWLAPGRRIAFRGLPSWFGRIDAELVVDDDGKTARAEARGVREGTQVRVRLPDKEASDVTPSDGVLKWTIEL